MTACSTPEGLLEEGDVLCRRHDYTAALKLYAEVVEQFGGTDEGDIGRLVRTALNRSGGALVLLGRINEADAAFDQLYSRARNVMDPTVMLRAETAVAKATLAGIELLVVKKHYASVIDAADSLVARFGGQSPPECPHAVIDTLVNKAWALEKMERADEAIDIYDDVVLRFGSSSDDYVSDKIARSLARKTDLLISAGDYEAAISTVNQLIQRFRDAGSSQKFLLHIVRGLNDKAIALGRIGRWRDAIAVDDEILALCENEPNPAVMVVTAQVLCHRAMALMKLGEPDEALAAWNMVISRYCDSAMPHLRELTIDAMENRVELLASSGHLAEAMTEIDELLKRLDVSVRPQELPVLVGALCTQAALLVELGKESEAVAVLDDVIERFRDSQEPEVRRHVAAAMRTKMVALDRLGELDASERTFHEMVEGFGDEALAVFEELADTARSFGRRSRGEYAAALLGKGLVLANRGNKDDALVVLDDVVRNFQADDDVAARRVVEDARQLRSEIAGDDTP